MFPPMKQISFWMTSPSPLICRPLPSKTIETTFTKQSQNTKSTQKIHTTESQWVSNEILTADVFFALVLIPVSRLQLSGLLSFHLLIHLFISEEKAQVVLSVCLCTGRVEADDERASSGLMLTSKISLLEKHTYRFRGHRDRHIIPAVMWENSRGLLMRNLTWGHVRLLLFCIFPWKSLHFPPVWEENLP